MAISDALLKSFASVTNDSNTSQEVTTGYGHVVIKNSDVYVILDSDLSESRIKSLTYTTNSSGALVPKEDFIVDAVGNGAPVLNKSASGVITYTDNNGTTISFTKQNGGDLYLDEDTNNLYISEKVTSTVNNSSNQPVSATELVWNKCCTITSATPAVGVANGDRVTISIKNHKILITGNLTNPGSSGSGSSGTVNIGWETENIDFSTYT